MKQRIKQVLTVAALMLFGTAFAFAEGEESVTEVMSTLVLQIGIIIFAVRVCGRLVKKINIPSVLGELLAGIIIGPFALGGLALPGFPHGIFPVQAGSLAVSPELYGFATIASIILLFASGLETDLGLFLRYSVAGGIIGLGGVIFSFAFGGIAGMLLLDASFMDPRCLFLGVLSTATSVGITARILSDQKKMDSPEGVTILAAAVFDDVLGIIMLAIILGIVAVISGSGDSSSLSFGTLGGIAGKAFGIWLGFTALGLIFSRKIASFLKLFKHSYDFSICAIGIALLLAGFFERQGLAMIIGAYVTGLSLSKTDIAAVIQERIHGLYEFFVPLFFAVMGMLVNVGELMSVQVLVFGLVYTSLAVLAKVLGCGLPALTLGFNPRGALRIGVGMVPRGEVALIIAGIGITAGILNEQLFGIVILMTLLTTLISPPLLNVVLNIPGRGTKKEAKSGNIEAISWDFVSDEIADLVIDTLLKNLRAEGFYVQMMNIDDGLSQARKDNVSLSITEDESKVVIEASPEDIAFVRTSMYEVVVSLHDLIERLKSSSDPVAFKKAIAEGDTRADKKLLAQITPACVSIDLKGKTKNEIMEEMIALIEKDGKILDRDQVLEDVLAREQTMSTGMQHGIALPHGKSAGISGMSVAIGVSKDGVDFGSLDGKPSKIFIMVVSPKKSSGPHVQFLAAITGLLRDEKTVSRLLSAKNPYEVASVLRGDAR